MSEQTYLFIDGEYLRQIHRDAMRSFFGVDGDLELSLLMAETQASRAYFYDSLDDSLRSGEDETSRMARISPLENFFASVRSLSGFHVRLGTVAGQGRRRRQKEVDILLAVDMLTHGFNGNMSKAVLLAGDLDFRPIVEALVRNGVFVEVWYHHSSIARDLEWAADFGRVIRFSQLHSWNTDTFKDAYRIPREDPHAGTPYGDLVRRGSLAAHPVELRNHPVGEKPHPLSLWITIRPGDLLCVRDTDAGLIERYVAVQYGPIQWESGAEEIRAAGQGG